MVKCIFNDNIEAINPPRIKINGEPQFVCVDHDDQIRKKLKIDKIYKDIKKTIVRDRDSYIIDIMSRDHKKNTDFGKLMKGKNKNY